MCGIAGAINLPDASYRVSLMLNALQHRGQQAAGIVSADHGVFYEKRGFGLAGEVFARTNFSQELPGNMALGHLRYPTSGDENSAAAIQPLTARTLLHGKFAVVHNGNLTNDQDLRVRLDQGGAIFRSFSDSETFLHLLARSKEEEFRVRLLQACSQVEGAYTLLVMSSERLYAVVDPAGFRPLVMARLEEGYLFASETCAFDLFPEVREVIHVDPGQLIEAGTGGHRVFSFGAQQVTRHCSFEPVYFSRPDSSVFGLSVSAVRHRLGTALARKGGKKTDIVIPVPDSSNTMALAYAKEAGIDFAFGFIRNHYTGRTFITPDPAVRAHGVRMKLNPDRAEVEGKTITVVDDSLVRGTTGKKVVALLREAGATEVHLRIASPPVRSPCYWGIDTPERAQLVAARLDVEATRQFMGADSLMYLSIDDLRQALGDEEGMVYCTSCFSGEKPLPDQLIPPEWLNRSMRT